MNRPFVYLVGAPEEPRTRVTFYAKHELHAQTLCKIFLTLIYGGRAWEAELLRGYE